MIPTLLITLREVIEASLIVATILGIFTKANARQRIKSVWTASLSALLTSFLLVVGGSVLGVNVSKIFEGQLFEGSLYIVSAIFVTWAVFFLHNQFAQKKMRFLSHLKESIAGSGLFAFTFIAVFREGIEITLFLSTLYLTSTPLSIISGFGTGVLLGISVSYLFFRAAIRAPVFYAFRVTSFLLILFAGSLLARGVGELLDYLPLYVIAHSVRTLPLLVSTSYIFLMHRKVFVHSRESTRVLEAPNSEFRSGRENRY